MLDNNSKPIRSINSRIGAATGKYTTNSIGDQSNGSSSQQIQLPAHNHPRSFAATVSSMNMRKSTSISSINSNNNNGIDNNNNNSGSSSNGIANGIANSGQNIILPPIADNDEYDTDNYSSANGNDFGTDEEGDDENNAIKADEPPLSDLQCALEVGQFLLDQNTQLEHALESARVECVVLQRILRLCDSSIVQDIIASEPEFSRFDSLISNDTLQDSSADPYKNNSRKEIIRSLRSDLLSSQSELQELKIQLSELTARNTSLRIELIELKNGSRDRKTIETKRVGKNEQDCQIAELEERIKEYELLFKQLKSQSNTPNEESAPQKPNSFGLKTPVYSPNNRLQRLDTRDTSGTTFVASAPKSTRRISSFVDNNALGTAIRQQQQPNFNTTPQQSLQNFRATSSSSGSVSEKSIQQPDWNIEPSPIQHSTQPEMATHRQNVSTIVPAPIGTSSSALMSHKQQQQQNMITVQNVTTHVEHVQMNAASLQIQQQEQEISSTNVNVIVRLMIGGFLLKYNKRRTKCERRFVNVNPYSRTISWSKVEPGVPGGDEITTVFVEDLTDGRSRIVIQTAHREVVFQCANVLEHAIWERGLTLILQNQSRTALPF
ncbi:hypothetical protein HK100_004422 [Physocladia obscura]|uniref:Pleckstrin homology domain-containing protein n=1 Tax=Physocladia obscura TaxID=109957 RepID=A0AAD5SUF1_9FUNG|nr:hypothetical protein HK100_004422 [Physocladia obscura]